EPHIDNPEIIQKVTDTIGTGDKGVLKSSEPTIYFCISGDGRNVGKKLKHVMVIFMILNDILHHHYADYHYTIALYPDSKKYNTLKFVLGPFLDDLYFLKNNRLEVSGIHWNFKLYFSSVWKFLAICLGINSANSKYFCPWCECSKEQRNDLNKNWQISKTIEQ
ncbi:27633_t:CDS:2, partial [Gigaspora margarita]